LRQLVGTAKRQRKLTYIRIPLPTIPFSHSIPKTIEIEDLDEYDPGPVVRHFTVENTKRLVGFHTIEVKLTSPIGRIPSQFVRLPIKLLKEYIYLEKEDMIKTILNSLKKIEDSYAFQRPSVLAINKKLTPSTKLFPEKVEGFKCTLSKNIFKATIL
jgi:hypothetical protein